MKASAARFLWLRRNSFELLVKGKVFGFESRLQTLEITTVVSRGRRRWSRVFVLTAFLPYFGLDHLLVTEKVSR